MRDLIKRTTGPHARGEHTGGAPLKERLNAARLSARQAVTEPESELHPELEPEPEQEVVNEPAPVAEEGGDDLKPPFPEQEDIAAIVEAAKAKRGGGKPAGKALQCLIVDDSRVVRKMSRKIVEELGYTATEAENGEEALARCRMAMPDLVITDWNMPVMTGLDFVAALRKLPGGDRTKVIFCTSNGGAKDVHKGIAAGADDYIVKPFGEAAMRAKLEVLAG